MYLLFCSNEYKVFNIQYLWDSGKRDSLVSSAGGKILLLLLLLLLTSLIFNKPGQEARTCSRNSIYMNSFDPHNNQVRSIS